MLIRLPLFERTVARPHRAVVVRIAGGGVAEDGDV